MQRKGEDSKIRKREGYKARRIRNLRKEKEKDKNSSGSTGEQVFRGKNVTVRH